MNRAFLSALGPELVWALFFVSAFLFVAQNVPSTEAGSQRLETVLWILPAAAVLCSFAPLLWNPGSAWWLLLRIALCGIFGLYFVVVRLCEAIDYGDSRNSGVGSGFMLILALGLCLLAIGVALSAIIIFIKGRLAAS